MSDKAYAVAIVTGSTPQGLMAVFLESYLPRHEWNTYEIRFGNPKEDPNDLRFTKGPPQADADAARSAFAALMADPPVGSLIAVKDIQGFHDDAAKTPFATGFVFSVMCGPDKAEAIVEEFARAESGSPDADMRISGRTETLFMNIPEFRQPSGGRAFLSLLGASEIEYAAGYDAASREPDDAIVWVSASGKAKMLGHRGGFLLYRRDAAGTDVEEIRMNGVPEDKGLYYVAGKPWVHHPIDRYTDDYDDGFDVTEAVPATDAHLALFGVEPDGYSEDIADFEAEQDEPAAAPAP